MIYDVSKFRSAMRATDDDVEVLRINDDAGLDEIVDIQEQVWSRSFGWLLDGLREMWDRASFYAAYEQGRLVGTGWIEYPEASQFAELHGGAVLPEFRGRGIYSRLFESRLIDALEWGARWVAVDAAPMSRPILEVKGFRRLDATYPMTWSFGRGTRSSAD